MRKVWKIALVVTLALALVVGIALPALAAAEKEKSSPNLEGSHRILKGVVVDKGDKSFTIKTGQGEVEIQVNPATEYIVVHAPFKLPTLASVKPRVAEQQPTTSAGQPANVPPGVAKGRIEKTPKPQASAVAAQANGEQALQKIWEWLQRLGKKGSFEDIAKGDRIAAWVVGNEDKPVAKFVLIVKPPVLKQVKGKVTAIDTVGQTIKIDTLGNKLIHYDATTIFVVRGSPSLAVNMTAIVSYVEQDGNIMAKRVVAGIPKAVS